MSEAATSTEPALKRTPLHDLHVRLGARMVPFAGYEMPVQYRDGILAEHNLTRATAGLFDVSHMGQAFLIAQDHATAARALETLVPADILNLAPGRQRYTQFLNADGGILDDLMVTRSAEPEEDGTLMLIVNASRKDDDFAHVKGNLPAGVRLMEAPHRALLALQGPQAQTVLAKLTEADLAAMPFMSARMMRIAGVDCHVSRSGYTGEDGFEISCNAKQVSPLAQALLSQSEVKPVGLGARDSLRLEAGLCLYGHDIDETTSPVEGGLTWSIQKRRREEGGFPGADHIKRELAEGAPRRRVGLVPEGRAPAREGARILATDGTEIGIVTSGGFGPSVGGPVAMGYVTPRFAEPGTPVLLVVRDKQLVAKVTPLPFVPHRYHR